MPFSDTTPLLEKLADYQWRTYQFLKYVDPKSGESHCIPKGFVNDLASVPRLFWSLFSPAGVYALGAIFHDHFYVCHEFGGDMSVDPPVVGRELSRSEADWIFLEMMEELGVGWLRRNIIWSAVRIGGGSYWDD
jgi:hypothetical protein